MSVSLFLSIWLAHFSRVVGTMVQMTMRKIRATTTVNVWIEGNRDCFEISKVLADEGDNDDKD